jgi:hypothetical protein
MRRRELIGWIGLIALVTLVACKKTEPATGGGSAKGSGAVTGAAPPLAAKDYFRVDAGPRTPCTAGTACEARLVLTALGSYHVNEKYPFKLVADASPGITIDGTGSFALEDPKTGTLTINTRRKSALQRSTGRSSQRRTDENRQIESPDRASCRASLIQDAGR